jgi:hypothetical protein
MSKVLKAWLKVMLSIVTDDSASPRMASRLSLAGIKPMHPAVLESMRVRINTVGRRYRFIV